MLHLDLTGEWYFRLATTGGTKVTEKKKLSRWLKAAVPGTVHTDLMSNGIIPDPYYRTNENDVQWIELCSWEYRKEFKLDSRWDDVQDVELVAEGLDTFTTISINGEHVADTENMFIEHRFDVKSFLRRGKNRIHILFHSPVRRVNKLEGVMGKLRVDHHPSRVYGRKAQYSFGWDWGPKLATSGIWLPIRLEGRNAPRLIDPSVKTERIGGEAAVVGCSVGVAGDDGNEYHVRIMIRGSDRDLEQSVPLRDNHAAAEIEIPKPRLWWPNGTGEQHLYCAVFQLINDAGEVVDTVETKFGIRTVRLLREPDADGESFTFEINGKKVFSKGANWIPADNFIPRIPAEIYEKLLTLAAHANMNTIRVWGGGIYEQKIFYDLCDRLGLMVWQDFMFACGEYPEYDAFVQNVRREAEYVVKKLRNHPSIILWCGNNECEYLFCNANPGRNPDEMTGAVLFRDVIREVCEQLDGTRPYWRSSPFGSGHPNDQTNGTHHQWEVWSNWMDYRTYSKVTARFVTEFGFQAPPHRKTFDEVTERGDRHFQSEVLEHHNKQVEGTERLYRFQAGHYRIGDQYEAFIYRGQLLQAEALKYAVEHWRSRKFLTAGSIIWQLNDCWPVTSWSLIDSGLRPKASYYYAKRFFAPLLVSFHHVGDRIGVRLINDSFADVRGVIVVDLMTITGVKKRLMKVQRTARSNEAAEVAAIPVSSLVVGDPSQEYLRVRFVVNGVVATENRYFFVEPKHFNLPKATVRFTIAREVNNQYRVDLTSRVFVRGVRLDLDDGVTIFSDNFFDIDGGEKKRVHFSSTRSLRSVKKMFQVHWLAH